VQGTEERNGCLVVEALLEQRASPVQTSSAQCLRECPGSPRSRPDSSAPRPRGAALRGPPGTRHEAPHAGPGVAGRHPVEHRRQTRIMAQLNQVIGIRRPQPPVGSQGVACDPEEPRSGARPLLVVAVPRAKGAQPHLSEQSSAVWRSERRNRYPWTAWPCRRTWWRTPRAYREWTEAMASLSVSSTRRPFGCSHLDIARSALSVGSQPQLDHAARLGPPAAPAARGAAPAASPRPVPSDARLAGGHRSGAGRLALRSPS